MSIIKNGKKIAGLYKADLVSPATDTQQGIIRIATEDEVQAGTSNATAVTPYQLANQAPKTLVDEATIIKDSEDTITAIGVQSKSGKVLYDWIGTNEEYEAGIADGSISSDWVCWITDDEGSIAFGEKANIDLSNLDEIGQGIIDGKASVDLDNLTESGEKHFLNKQQITNCITEITQRIKYTLENGTLTIKAGSVVIVPYGTTDRTSEFPVGATFINDNFKVYDTQFEDGKFFVWAEVHNNISGTPTTTDTNTRFIILYVHANSVDGAINSASGTSITTSALFYNTSTNLIEYLTNGANTDGNLAAFPLGISKANGTNKFATIQQIFNGFGYIGSTVWVDKGVKGLIPNGRNEDGTLKNIELTIDKVVTRTSTETGNYTGFISSAGNLGNTTIFKYDPIRNVMYNNNTGVTVHCLFYATFKRTSGVVSDFKAYETFRAVDYSDSSTVSAWAMPSNKYINLALGASGTTYTAPANGYFSCEITANTASGSWGQLRNNTKNISTNLDHSRQGAIFLGLLPATKGDVCQILYGEATVAFIRFIYAEGDK